VDLTWPEYAARVADSCPVLLPIGALEQHGQHLPLDTDTMIAVRLAERVAGDLGGIVLPPLVYGARSLARSGGGDHFPGTVNLDGSTLIALVRDIVREQARHGVRTLIALLGHGENDPFVIEGAVLGQRDVAVADLRILVLGWWHVVKSEDLEDLFPDGFPGWDLEHAARVETSLMLALAPERVHCERMSAVDPVTPPPYSVLPTPQGTVPVQGSLADPRGANEEAGHALIALIRTRLVDAIRQALTDPGSEIVAST
jgi:creatinine amidohydrolase